MQLNYKISVKSAFCTVLLTILAIGSISTAQDKQLVEALGFKPIQSGDVDYDTPSPDEIKDCKIETITDPPGFLVTDSNGRILRKFTNNNKDKYLDSWAYYKDGLEVYRDVDSNFDSKADQHRWVGMAGIRWGIDRDQDGKIDFWKEISAQEVAREVFIAYQTGDAERFQRVLISPSELKSLQLGDKMSEAVNERLAEANKSFAGKSRAQRDISSKGRFEGFGTSTPYRIAAGNNGIESDVIIYDHAAAMFSDGSDFGQLDIGTVVQVGPATWRAIEMPDTLKPGKVVSTGGVFFQLPNMAASSVASSTASSEEMERINELWSQLEEIDKKLKTTRGETEQYALEKQHASVTTEIINITEDPADRSTWIRALADRVANAYQQDRFRDGLDYLDKFFGQMKDKGIDEEELAYVKYRIINARWSKALDGDSRERFEANKVYNEELEDFAGNFPKNPLTAQALSHLAMNYELAERDDPKEAIKWYKRLASQFPDTSEGKRARGAIVRLEGQGKPLSFAGRTLKGQLFDIKNRALRDKVVLIHYWDTNCELCIEGFEELKKLNAKYKNDLVIVGANLDTSKETMADFLSKNRSVNWIQLWDDGGLDGSRLVEQLGITVVPAIFLVDQKGNLVETDLSTDDIEREIQRLTRRTRNARRDN